MTIPVLNIFTKWHDLLNQLVGREIKARYKQSILGYAWVVIVPVIRLVVMTIVFSYFFRIDTGIPYPLFLFAALVPWTFTSNAVSVATGSVIANSSLITKIKLPREIFPISTILVKGLDFILSFGVLLVLLGVYRYPLHLTILFIPVILLVQILLVFGVSFVLSAFNVFYRDVENLLEVFLMVWMYLTPVIYPPEFIPARFQTLFNLNPMMGIVNAYRNVILHGVLPPWESFGYATGLSVLIFFAGYWYFRRKARYFADVL